MTGHVAMLRRISLTFAGGVVVLFALSVLGMRASVAFPWNIGLVPHATCWQNRPLLVWGTSIADFVIWLAYMAIPTLIVLLVSRNDLPFPGTMYLAACFILACGFTHYFDAVTTWWPIYYAAMVEKWITAIVSVLFVIVAGQGMRWLETHRQPLAQSVASVAAHLRRTDQELAATLESIARFLAQRTTES